MSNNSSGNRVWVHPTGVFHNLIVMTGSRVLYGKVPADKLDSIAEHVRGGEIHESVEGACKVIPMGMITKVRFNRHSESATVYFGEKKEAKSPELDFQDGEARDLFCEWLGEAIRFDSKEVRLNPATAMVKPVIGLAVTGGVIWLLFAMAQELAGGEEIDTDGRRGLIKKLFVWVVDLLGATGVLIVGGLIGLCIVLWLVARVKTPPIMVTYKPRV